MLNPYELRSDYVLDVPDDDLQSIDYDRDDDILVFAIVTIPEDESRISANLQGPIIVNRARSARKTIDLARPALADKALRARRARELRDPLMLVLARKINESIVIGDSIHVSVIDIKGDQVKLGIDAPKQVKVYRQEVYEAIQEENRKAARSAALAVPWYAAALVAIGRPRPGKGRPLIRMVPVPAVRRSHTSRRRGSPCLSRASSASLWRTYTGP
jgi:carbon storage regulator